MKKAALTAVCVALAVTITRGVTIAEIKLSSKPVRQAEADNRSSCQFAIGDVGIAFAQGIAAAALEQDRVDILLLMDDGLGANYDIDDTSLSIMEQFERFGWHVTTAALSKTVERCDYSRSLGLLPRTADFLVSEIADITEYDVLCLLPGNTGLENIGNSNEALDLIRSAADSGLVVAAWCKAVRVLAAADLVNGLEITGHPDYRAEYEAAGASYQGRDHPPIIQGNIVTSVRGRYYRTAMCEAIRDALPPSVRQTSHHLSRSPELAGSVIVTSKIADHAGIASIELKVDTGNGFFTVDMFDDGNHEDGQAGDSLFGGVLPPTLDPTVCLYYLRVTDSVGVSAVDPPGAPKTTYRR
ncbi:MAG TPA: DJ-1/PfpI family protein [Acidobacteriota bacterium]|nr:DJ-1/PfpI family protein [Acidobacteriota bacterium]